MDDGLIADIVATSTGCASCPGLETLASSSFEDVECHQISIEVSFQVAEDCDQYKILGHLPGGAR